MGRHCMEHCFLTEVHVVQLCFKWSLIQGASGTMSPSWQYWVAKCCCLLLAFSRSAIWLLDTLSVTEALKLYCCIRKLLFWLDIVWNHCLNLSCLFGSFFSNLLLKAELSAYFLCCHHISFFAGAAELFFGRTRTIEGNPTDTAPLYRNPDLLITDQVFHAKDTSDYSIPSWRYSCWWEMSWHQLFIPCSAADLT